MAEEEVGASEHADLHDHLDNAVFTIFFLAIAIYAIGAVGRMVGNKVNAPGVTAFFGG